jgi:hypothetical protein
LQRFPRRIVVLFACASPLCAQTDLRPGPTQSARAKQAAKSADELPDAPSATANRQNTSQAQENGQAQAEQTSDEPQKPKPTVQPGVVDPFSFGGLPTSTQKGPMSVEEKFAYFEKPVFGPRTIVTTAFGVGRLMANPPSGYPHEWRAGAAAFGRNYGNLYAHAAAMSFGRFSADALLHEDPRYSRSHSKSFFGRSAHAIGFTFIDKTDGGHSTLAFGNFVVAAAAGFVGNAYLPDGWNNTTHAGQRSVATFGGVAAQNFVQEFSPEIGQAFRRLHIPKLPLPPIWWTGGSHK